MDQAVIGQLISGYSFSFVIFVLSIVPAILTERLARFAAGHKKWPRRIVRAFIFFTLFGFEFFCVERSPFYIDILRIMLPPAG